MSGRIEGIALNRVIHGSILDAYGTEFFGTEMGRSEESKELLLELAQLNRKALKGSLDNFDKERLTELRQMLPTTAATVAN